MLVIFRSEDQKGDKMKADLKLKDFLTLIGPAQLVRVIDEEAGEPEAEDQEESKTLYKGVAAKARDEVDTERMIKFIIPEALPEEAGRHALKIYIY